MGNVNMENVELALSLMAQGMAGIFVSIIIIMIVICLIPKIPRNLKKNKDVE